MINVSFFPLVSHRSRWLVELSWVDETAVIKDAISDYVATVNDGRWQVTAHNDTVVPYSDFKGIAATNVSPGAHLGYEISWPDSIEWWLISSRLDVVERRKNSYSTNHK